MACIATRHCRHGRHFRQALQSWEVFLVKIAGVGILLCMAGIAGIDDRKFIYGRQAFQK
jgi:hypothetical protein